MQTYADVLKAKAQTASAVSADRAKLATDQAAVTADQAQLATDQQADAASDKAIAALVTSPNPPVFVDTASPNADGTVNVYIGDTSPAGYHVVAGPTSGSPVPAPAATS